MNRYNLQMNSAGKVIFSFCPHKQHGFTLIELLVVIAIISLLVSILMPSLQKARELTRQVICQTRLKAIGSALYIYINDFNGKGPVGYSSGGSRGDWSDYPNGVNPYGAYYGWYFAKQGGASHWALGEYLGVKEGDQKNDESVAKSKIAIYCPNAEHKIRACTARTFYALNAWYGYDTHLGDHVERMAATPMMMDGWDPTNDYMRYVAHPRHLWGNFHLYFLGLATHSHNDSGNFLFFDGHVENQEGPPRSMSLTEAMDFYVDDLGWHWY